MDKTVDGASRASTASQPPADPLRFGSAVVQDRFPWGDFQIYKPGH